MPISVGLAPSSSKKLVSNTPPVMLEKRVAKTPSAVAALKLVRISSLETLRLVGSDRREVDFGGSVSRLMTS